MENTKPKIPLIIFVVIVSAAVAEVCSGINSILFPVTLEGFGLSKSLIGFILSAEILAIVCLSPFMSRIIGRLGIFASAIIGTIGRSAILIALTQTNSAILWIILLFLFGSFSNIFAIALQSWVNFTKIPGAKGLVIGIYSASLSIGVALGPIIFQYISINRNLAFTVSASIAMIALIPLFFAKSHIPKITTTEKTRIFFVIKKGKYVMFSALVGGITFWGLPSFLTLYGKGAGLSVEQASLLVTMFMTGGLIIGLFIGYFSDRFDRKHVILTSFFVGLMCSVFLPMAIVNVVSAYILLFIWGGVMEGVSSGGLTLIGEQFRLEDQVSANIAYTLMDAIGGALGILLIGFAMDFSGTEGLVYVIVGAAVIYFNFALTQYKVE